ncbi:hypothetical protein GUITHDRAFT_115981 [Guillardia theta CCMP2712]|uniref:Uncharacterized protein n=1 Tax=Guillardia theta (strain CCMP2712) TaxID=905079 RepID=L1INI9_GUITC|nr:hypothetical protein GUITHDRAFT_115981 [Guillardia theta CCMP2712]EKX37841.1 hypothetical protein GUITHDRAFT_115981 [Guillardia theta CCMP2712]|eukprot:XP_005824821.1 hypothetical protein GUITHDRAFT_115981 [Guillardia theta CCMP2712]
MAQLHFDHGVKDLKATNFKIYWGQLGNTLTKSKQTSILSPGHVVEVYMPGFTGGSNFFGASRGSTESTESTISWMSQQNSIVISQSVQEPWQQAISSDLSLSVSGPGAVGCMGIVGDVSSNAFDLKQLRANVFDYCEWNAQREMLRLRLSSNAPSTVTGVFISKVSMYLNYDTSSKQNGLGPLPPLGGINEEWHQMAFVSVYEKPATTSSDCTGVSLSAFASTTCSTANLVYQVPFDKYKSQRFGSDRPRLPVRKEAGAIGVTKNPTFVYAAAAGNTDGINQAVCITVTIVPSMTIYSSPTSSTPTTLTISGLTGSSTPDQVTALYQNKCQCESTQAGLFPSMFQSISYGNQIGKADFVQGAGTLTFQLLPGMYIQAGEVVIFSFQLKTPGTVSAASKPISISMSGKYCQISDFCTGSTGQSITLNPITFSPSTKILQAVGNKIGARMFQSSSDTGSLSNMFVTLSPNFDIQTSSILTFTGLCGTQESGTKVNMVGNRFAGGNPLTDKCSSSSYPTEVDIGDPSFGYTGSTMDWSQSSGTLKLTLTQALAARGDYAFAWSWRVSDRENSACTMTVSLTTGPNQVQNEAVTNLGGSVGLVEKPSFTKYKIGQVTTRPDVTNYICVTLKTNFNLQTYLNAGQYNEATITLSGLSGSQAQDNSNPDIDNCPSYDWNTHSLVTPSKASTAYFTSALTAGEVNKVANFAAGIAKLVLNPAQNLPSGHEIKFAIPLKNSKVAQPCQTVTLTLNALYQSQNSQVSYTTTQTVQMVVSPVNRALQDGEMDGDACPLKVYDKGFLTRLITQQTPLIQENNVLTISLRSNVDLGLNGYGATITIAGLTGTDTTQTSLTALSPASTDYYSPIIQKTEWSQSNGQMIIHLPSSSTCQMPIKGITTHCMMAGWTYVLQYAFVNGKTPQSNPTVSISASFASGEQTNSQTATLPLSSYKNPLFLTSNLFNKYDIGQLYPAPGAVNPVCVTLRPNKNIIKQTKFTLTGLPMFTSTSTVDFYDEYGISPLSSTSLSGYFTTISGNNIANKADYNNGNGEIQFQFVTQTLVLGTKYKFCFRMINPNSAYKNGGSCPSVSLLVSSSDAPSAAPGVQTYTMKQDTGKRVYGYPSVLSSCAGYIVDPSFPHATIRSSSNVTSNTVWMTVELQPNYALTTSQAVTVSSLTGFIASPDTFPCWISRNGEYVNVASNAVSGNIHGADFASTCTFKHNEFKMTYQQSPNLPVYNPYFNVNAMRSNGICEIVALSGGSGYTVPPSVVICGSEFYKNSVCSGGNVMYGVGQGATATATISGGAVTAITITDPGHGYYLTPVVIISPAATETGTITAAKAQAYLYDRGVYTVQFQIQNPSSEQSALALSIQATSNFPSQAIVSGSQTSGLQMTASSSDVVLNIVPQTRLFAGDSLFVNLPAYEVEESGPLFGVQSSNSAFETFTSQLEWELFGSSEDRARAYLSKGYIADGNRHRSGDADVDGVFVLSPSDDGYKKNKDLCWSHKQCPWGASDYDVGGQSSYTLSKVRFAGPSPLGYTHEACYTAGLSASASDYVGMQISCRNNAFTAAASGSSVTAIKVKSAGLYTVTVQASAQTVTISQSDAGAASSASASISYQVAQLSLNAVTLENCQSITFTAAAGTQLIAASAQVVMSVVASTSAPAYRVEITNPGLYTSFPTATCTGTTPPTLNLFMSVATVSVTSQGSGYVTIPSVFLSAAPTGVTQTTAPVFEVIMSTANQNIITQTILDYNPYYSPTPCFLVGQEFPSSFLSDCSIHVKENVGRYTGMTAMIGSNEYLIKQGAGGVYWVVDSNGNKPRNVDIANKPYTIYTQLELIVAKSARVEPGESVSITIPGYRFKSYPKNVNAYITRSTDDASKTIAERTRYYFATTLPVKSSYVKGYGVTGMVITGGTLAGDCSIKYVDGPQSMGGNKPEVRFISGATSKFEITYAGSGYTSPPRFIGQCVTSTGTTTYFNGVFLLSGNSGVRRVEVAVQGNNCPSGTTVNIESPNPSGSYIDGLTGLTYAGQQASAIVLLNGNSVSQVVLQNGGSGYISAPLVTFPATCNAQAQAYISQNFSSSIAMRYETGNTFLYEWNREQTDTLTGLYSSEFSSVSLFSLETAASGSAEMNSGYVASIAITKSGTTCTSPTITVSASGVSAAAQAKAVPVTAANILQSINVTYGGYGYTSAPSVTITGCGAATAKAFLSYSNVDVLVGGSTSFSSYRGMRPLQVTQSSANSYKTVNPVTSAMDSPVLVGFNEACSNGKTEAYQREQSTYKNSRVTGVTMSSAGAGYTFKGTTVTFSASPLGSSNMYATAKGVPTWSFPPTTTSSGGTTNLNTNVLLYKGAALSTATGCDNIVLMFSYPERAGGAQLQIQINSAASRTSQVIQQGTGYASIPYVYDIKFNSNNGQTFLKDGYTGTNGNCVPQYFAIDVTRLTNLASGVGLVIDGVYMTQGGYGYDTAPTVTFDCKSCTITSQAVATATLESGCFNGQCTQPSYANAFFSPVNRNNLQVCQATNPGANDYRTRKTLQMRVSSGQSGIQYSSSTAYAARRNRGFMASTGSLNFYVSSQNLLSAMCTPPQVVVEPPTSMSGVAAQVELVVESTRADSYLSQSPATAADLPAQAAQYKLAVRTVNPGSGYITAPTVSFVSVGSTPCSTTGLVVAAELQGGMSVSTVQTAAAPLYICPAQTYYLNPTTMTLSTTQTQGAATITWDRKANAPYVVDGGYGYSYGTQPVTLSWASCGATTVVIFFEDSKSLDGLAPYPSFWPGDMSVDQSTWRNHAGEITGVDFMYESKHFYSNPTVPTPQTFLNVNIAARSLKQAGLFSSRSNDVRAAASISFAVEDASSFKAGDLILIDSEIFKIGTVTGNTITVSERALGGTSQSQHFPGASVVLFFPGTALEKAVLTSVAGTVETIYVASASGFAVDESVAVDDEFMLVASVDTTANTLSVYRGYTQAEGTETPSHPAAALVGLFNPKAAVAKTSASITATATTLPVFTTRGFTANTYIQIGNEIMLITALNTGSFTILRAQAYTQAASHASGAEYTAVSVETVSLLPIALNTDLSISDTLISMGPNAGKTGTLPAQGTNILVEQEVIYVLSLNKSASTITVSRGQQGTTAAAHNANAEIVLSISAQYLSETIIGATGVLQSISGSNSGLYARPLITNPGTTDATPMLYLDGIAVISSPSKLQKAPVLSLNYLAPALTPFGVNQDLIVSSLSYPVIYNPAKYSTDPLYYQDRMDGYDLMRPNSPVLESSSNRINGTSPVYILDSFGQMLGDHVVGSESIAVTLQARTSAISTNPVLSSTASSTLTTKASYKVTQQSSSLGSVWGAPSKVYSPFLGYSIKSVAASGVQSPATLSAQIDTTTVTVSLTAAVAYITVNSFIRIDNEVMKVSAVTGNTLTIVRAQRSTYATTHATNANVYSDCIGRLYAEPSLEGGEPAILDFSGTSVTVVSGGSGYLSSSHVYACGSVTRCDYAGAQVNTCSLTFTASLGPAVTEVYLNHTVATRALGGQMTGLTSSSSRFFLWKTRPSKVSMVVSSAASNTSNSSNSSTVVEALETTPSPTTSSFIHAADVTTTPAGTGKAASEIPLQAASASNVGVVVGCAVGGVIGAGLLGFLTHKFVFKATMLKFSSTFS